MRAILFLFVFAAVTGATGAQISADTEAKIGAVAEKVLAETGVPSASVGVVQGGKIVYARAFGMARVAPAVKAEATMAYPVGSISKQFTSTAVLLLQQEGKLSVDDKVAKYFPELTRANDVTLRNLMTMTSGYQDFAPQDYIIPAFRRPEDPLTTVHEWAGKPLDFEPGTEWQYSNTNYVLVALIVQKVTGEPFYQFLRERVLEPLKLEGVFNAYTASEKLEVTGYVSNAMAKPRVLPLEAPGWYFGDGELAMPASTLLAWDMGMINQSLLTAASYKEMETPFVLKSGRDSTYGLGIHVFTKGPRLKIEHSGEVGGYVAENVVYPNDRAAVVVLTNEVASSAAQRIAAGIEPLLFGPVAEAKGDAFVATLRGLMGSLQKGEIDRGLLTLDASSYFDRDALQDFQSTLAPLGSVTGVSGGTALPRGGMRWNMYRVAFSGGTTVLVSVGLMPDGKIEQLLVVGKE